MTKDNKLTALAVIIAIALILGGLAGVCAYNSFPQRIENMAQDTLYQKPSAVPNNIKIIAIDEKTLGMLGPYSDWDRSYFARLIDILNQSEETAPEVIGIDVVFSGTNGSQADKELVRAASKMNNIILASTINFDEYVYGDSDGYHKLSYVHSEGKPYDELSQVADYGFTNAIYDSDGFVRRAYTSITARYNGQDTVFESFSYKIAKMYGCEKSFPSTVEIAFVGNPGDFEIISMADVLEGKISEGYFRDCIVLVGAYEEGMMDSYRVPIDYSSEMYGVEYQANIINSLLCDTVIYPVNSLGMAALTGVLVTAFSFVSMYLGIKLAAILLVLLSGGYIASAVAVFSNTLYKMNLVSVPLWLTVAFLTALLYKYILMHKSRLDEMQGMLFSMAEAMSEAIEGRTPYNANHTKNVAKRSVEMLDFINEKYRSGKTDLHFSKQDRLELYLAAMLHDVGKMDIPLEIMDKPTKLGSREKALRDRLEIISLRIKNDMLCGRVSKEQAQSLISKIDVFVSKLGLFNCGKPLSDEELAIIDGIAQSVYTDSEGNKTAYLTEEEIADLHIRAGTLSDKERELMQNHVVHTDKILSHMRFGERFKNVRRMAADHHELLNGKGYPNGIGSEEIDTMTRILTVMDIYDSLIADDRPYKKPKSVKVAFEILYEEAQRGKVDKTIVDFANELYGQEKQAEE